MRIVCSVLAILFFLSPVSARDLDGRYANSPNKHWFESQRRPGSGVPCCEEADGHRLDDAQWDIRDDGHYTVFVSLDGKSPAQWVIVPDEAVINPDDRPKDVGYAVVWIFQGIIFCFMPGAGT